MSSKLSLVFALVLISNLGQAQTYQFPDDFQVGGPIFTGTNEISAVYTEGTKDPLLLKMREEGDLSCERPIIYISDGKYILEGCGYSNLENYDKVLEVRKNSGDSFNAESVIITPSNYRPFPSSPYELLLNVYIRGFKNGVQKGEIHLTNLVHAQNYPIDFSGYTGFDDLDMLYFFVDNQNLFIDDLTLSPLTQAPVLPVLSTNSASGILNDRAVLGGNITNDGGAPITSRGVVWSTSLNPTISSNRVNIGTGSGSFSTTVTGLPTSTTVYVRAFGVNSVGVAYGNQISFTTPSDLVAQVLSTTDESCLGNDGAISIGAIGGTPPYSYLWLFDNSTLSSRNDLTGGSYTIRVSDVAGDMATAIVNLGTQDPLVLTPNLTQVSCAGGNNGAASVTVTGGAGVYTYSWSVAGETGSRIENLIAGNYSVTVKDQSGCEVVQNFTISEPAPLAASITSVSDVSCIGGNNGAAQISVTGGTPPYSYSWNPTNVNSPEIIDVSAGTYQVLVRDANFCEVTQTVTIDEPDLPLLVNTGSATEVLATSARVSGSATVDLSGFGEPGSCVSKAGFVYSISINPDISFGTVAYVDPFDLSGFSSLLTNLRPNTVHYVRAFVENSSGSVTYGNEQSFTTDALNLSIGGSFSVTPKNYDGSTSAEISIYNLVLSGLDPTYNKVELENVVVEFETESAGINKPVRIVSADITGPDAESYDFSLLNAPASTGTILKKNLSLTGLSASSKTYDGLTDAIVTGVPGLSGVVDGDDVILSGTPEYDFMTSNAGQNLEISTTGLLLTGTDASNYELFVTALFADIFKRQLVMEDPSITLTKVFDGLRQAASSIGNPINLVSGDDLTVTGSAQYDNASVGSGKEIVLTYTTSGNSVENYLTPASFQRTDGEITPAELLVTVTGESKEFGDLDPVFLLQYSGFVSGDDASVVLGTPSFTRDSGEDVGNYSVGVSGLSSLNYSIQVTAGNLEITQRSMQITMPFLTKAYGDLDPVFNYTTDPAQGLLLPNGLRVELNGSVEREPGEDVGDYIIEIGTIKDLNPNYLISHVAGLLSIVPKEVQVIADGKSKIYGDLDPAFTYTSIPAVGEELANGLVVSFSGELQRQPGETVGTYLISKGTLTNPNFNIVFQDGQLEITPFTVELKAQGKSKTYGELDPPLTFVSIPALGETLSNGLVVDFTGSLEREPGESVGIYQISKGTVTNPNFAIAFQDAQLEITPLAIEVQAESQNKMYGELDPVLSFTVLPALGTILGNGEVISLSGGLARNPGEDVGIYDIGLGTISNPNLSISFIESSFTITKKQVTVLAAGKAKVYGEIDPELTFTAVPAVGSILPNGEVLSFSGNLSRAVGEQVGIYEILQGSLANPNYEFAYTGEKLEITPLEVRVNAEALQKVYGDLDPAFSFTSIPSVSSSLPNGLELAFSGNLSRVAGENVGFYDIGKGTLSNPNFEVIFQKAQLEIKALPIKVTANNQSKTFGEFDPQLTYTSLPAAGSFLENGQVVSFFGGLQRLPGENIGTYSIQQGDLSNPNYQFEFTAGLFTINPLHVHIVANAASKVYGETDPALTFTASPQPGSPLPNGQVFTISGSLSRNPGEDVGTYAINQGSLSSPNIQFDFVGANLSILPKDLDIIPIENQRKIYGDPDPDFEFRINGLLQRDPVSIVSGAIGRVQGEAVGTYKFTLGNLSAGANYRLVLKDGEFTIVPKDLIIRAENKEKRYGDPNPELTYVIEGLVNGDQGIDQLPVISTPAIQASSVGTYPILLSGGADPNYAVTLINAELKVLKRSILVKAEDKEMSYGDQVPALTYSFVGLVNGDQDLEIKPTLETSATSNSNVGTYPIRISGGGDPNYVLTYQNGILSIRPRVLEVIADSKKRTYGDPNPVLTYTLSGLVNGDQDLTGKPELTVSANPDSFVGNYPILVSGGSHPNYSLTYKEGVLEIVPAILRISALPSSKVFGAADPVLTYQASGFKLSDGIGLGIGHLTRAAGEVVGNYPIAIGTLSFGDNYAVQFETADFEIVPVQILAITDPVGIQTPWGTVPEFPDQVQVVTQDGRIISMNVNWSEQDLNVFDRGAYFVKGQVVLIEGLTNPSEIFPTLMVTVLPKPLPQDLILSNNRFIPDPKNFFQAIGNFSVVDPVDNVHAIALVQTELDNGFFEIKENILFWSSAEQASGKSQFSIRVQVTDRDGNTLVKDFTIIRERIVLSTLEVYNSFSPNGDGFNDTWGVPDLRYYKNVRVHIFNIEGRRVFYTEDPDFRWNGTFNGVDLATDTFQWVIEIEETGEKRNGYLHLIR